MTPISDLELSIRAYNCLTRAGYKYVEDLQYLEEEDLFKIRNLGRKCMKEILEKIKDFDFSKEEKLPQCPDKFSFTVDTSEIRSCIKSHLGESIRYNDYNMRPIIATVVKEIINENKNLIIGQIVEVAAAKISKEALPKLIERITK